MKPTKTLSGLGALSGLVYSTDTGRTCPDCRQAKADCRCGRPVLPKGDGVVRVSRETKGRAGKGVTLVKGVQLDEAGLIALGKVLKTACGSGGTVKDGVIEVQGDHCERVVELLKKTQPGWTIKRAGG
jgi:translation initiation factor 1